MATIPLAGVATKIGALSTWAQERDSSEKLPVLFLGHGSPMNAIEENEFVRGFREIGRSFETPRAVLCISAHWETRGTWVTAMDSPRTIHDFGGFPKALFDVQYPAPGNPELAKEVADLVQLTEVGMNHNWGLDHGAWSVIKHLYPEAKIPVLQMSIDMTKPPRYHYELAKELAALRRKGVLIVGSGNIVHNLRMVAWNKLDQVGYAYDWATEVKQKTNEALLNGHHDFLIDFQKNGAAFDLAIPTPEHYLPLLYTIGLSEKGEDIELFNDKSVAGSLSMTSVKIK